MYVPTNSEILISNILLEHGIDSISKLNIYDLAKSFELRVWYADCGGILIHEHKVIIINQNLSPIEKYQQFVHELAHYIREDISFQYLEEYQHKYIELKTNSLMPYIMMPYFCIEEILELGTVEAVANYFFVSHDMARKRLEGIWNRTRGEMIYASLQRQKNREMVLSNQLH